MSISSIHTQKGLSVFWRGKTHNVDVSAPHFQEVLSAVTNDDEDALAGALASAEIKIATQLDTEGESEIVVSNGAVYFNNTQIDNSLTKRIVQLANEGRPIGPLKNFLRNLMLNPSYRAVQDLYSFLEVGGMPITPDGHFLAYKAVRDDWYDIHSGTFDNSIGRTVQMPRNMVDENPEVTCSAGLHVCSYGYLPGFAHADGHVIVVKINPADVVAIPTDYNNSKMRVSKYVVQEEVEGWYAQHRDSLRECSGFSADWDEYDDSPEDECNDPDDNSEDDSPEDDSPEDEDNNGSGGSPGSPTDAAASTIFTNINGIILWWANENDARHVVDLARTAGAKVAFGYNTKTFRVI